MRKKYRVRTTSNGWVIEKLSPLVRNSVGDIGTVTMVPVGEDFRIVYSILDSTGSLVASTSTSYEIDFLIQKYLLKEEV